MFGGFCDRFGCIWTFQIANVLWILGSIVSFILEYIYVLILGRVAKGLTIGLVTCLIPVYIYEIFPLKKKGEAISVFHISTTTGIITMYFVGHILEKHTSRVESFKISWGIQGIPGVVVLILTFTLPESPKWLASKARWKEAAKSLQRVRTHKRTKAESNDKSYVTNAYTSGTKLRYASFTHLFTRHFKKTSTGILLHLFIQLTSINTLMYFFTYLCDLCGLDGDTKLAVVSIQYILLGLLTFIPLVVLDRARRVDFLVYGILVMGITYFGMFLTGILHQEDALNDNSPFDWILEREAASTMIALFLFLVSVYASSLATVSWLYIGELFQDEERTKGTSVCMCVGFIIHGITTLLLPLAFEVISHWVFAILSLFCLIGCIVFMWFPETKETLFDDQSISLATSDLQTVTSYPTSNGGINSNQEDPKPPIILNEVNELQKLSLDDTNNSSILTQSESFDETNNYDIGAIKHHLKQNNPKNRRHVITTNTIPINRAKPRKHKDHQQQHQVSNIFKLSSPDIDSENSPEEFLSNTTTLDIREGSEETNGTIGEVIDAYSPFEEYEDEKEEEEENDDEDKSVHPTAASTDGSLSDGSYFSDDWNSDGNHKSKTPVRNHVKLSFERPNTANTPINLGLATFSIETGPRKFSTKPFPGQQPLILDKRVQATTYIPFEGLRITKTSPSHPIKKSKNKLHST